MKRDAILSLGPMRQDVGFRTQRIGLSLHYSLERPGSSCLNRRPSLPWAILKTCSGPCKDLCSELALEEGAEVESSIG